MLPKQNPKIQFNSNNINVFDKQYFPSIQNELLEAYIPIANTMYDLQNTDIAGMSVKDFVDFVASQSFGGTGFSPDLPYHLTDKGQGITIDKLNVGSDSLTYKVGTTTKTFNFENNGLKQYIYFNDTNLPMTATTETTYSITFKSTGQDASGDPVLPTNNTILPYSIKVIWSDDAGANNSKVDITSKIKIKWLDGFQYSFTYNPSDIKTYVGSTDNGKLFLSILA